MRFRIENEFILCINVFMLIAGFIGAGLDFSSQQRLMWYILFVVYAPYAMLPLPLRWCVLAGYGTALTHMVMAGITLLRDPPYVRILDLYFDLFFQVNSSIP